MRLQNPVFRNFGSSRSLRELPATSGRMTLYGILHKTFILLVLFIVSSEVGWIQIGALLHRSERAYLLLAFLLLACSLGGMILVWITVFKKVWSPVTAPIYAIVQGVIVGFLSAGMDRRFSRNCNSSGWPDNHNMSLPFGSIPLWSDSRYRIVQQKVGNRNEWRIRLLPAQYCSRTHCGPNTGKNNRRGPRNPHQRHPSSHCRYKFSLQF